MYGSVRLAKSESDQAENSVVPNIHSTVNSSRPSELPGFSSNSSVLRGLLLTGSRVPPAPGLAGKDSYSVNRVVAVFECFKGGVLGRDEITRRMPFGPVSALAGPAISHSAFHAGR